jgi:hypothetical protein
MPRLAITSGLPAHPAGLPDKEANLVLPLYRALGNVAQAASLATGGVTYTQDELASLQATTKLRQASNSRLIVKAGEALSYGMLLNLYLDGSTITARKADRTLGRAAAALLDFPAGLTSGSFGDVLFMSGYTTSISGSTLMQFYYLSTAGLVQNTAPTTTGEILQPVGIGLGTSGFFLQISPPTELP